MRFGLCQEADAPGISFHQRYLEMAEGIEVVGEANHFQAGVTGGILERGELVARQSCSRRLIEKHRSL